MPYPSYNSRHRLQDPLLPGKIWVTKPLGSGSNPCVLSLAISPSAAAVLQCIPVGSSGCAAGGARPGLEREWLKCGSTKWPLPQILLSMERVKTDYLSRDVSPISARGLVEAAAPERCWSRAGAVLHCWVAPKRRPSSVSALARCFPPYPGSGEALSQPSGCDGGP